MSVYLLTLLNKITRPSVLPAIKTKVVGAGSTKLPPGLLPSGAFSFQHHGTRHSAQRDAPPDKTTVVDKERGPAGG